MPRQADAPLDEAQVAEIERSIQQQAPTLEGISQAASVAQERVAGTSPDQTRFAPETKEAIRRELKRRLRPEDPEVQEIVKGVAGRLSRNPREIKRFVNVFRFYAVIRQEREAAGFAVPDTLAEVAKLAVLAVRWPHLRSALGRQVGKTDRDTLLTMLEEPLRELPDDADTATRISALKKALDKGLLPEALCTEVAASEDLCLFLSAPPAIGTAAPGYL